VPGIKVRKKEDLIQEYDPQTFVNDENETADPLLYSTHGGLFKQLKDRMNTFMRNEPEVNVILSSLILKLSSLPVKLDTLDGQFNSTTSPYDKTHANLTMLHMVLFDQPLAVDKLDVFSLMSSFATVNARVDEFMQDENMAQLVQTAR